MVKVCDAIMGTGKSSAAIRYMNERPDEKFIYITPYLDEATRIKNGCPSLHFIEPCDKIPKYNYKKSEHTRALIEEGKNITTTHQAFKGYTEEMLSGIRKMEYTLIIDENVDVLESFDSHPEDLQMLVDLGFIDFQNDEYFLTGKEYNGSIFRELFRFMKSRRIVKIGSGNNSLFYWALPPELILAFKDVFILTYLFEGQGLHHFLELSKIPYEYIGIQRTDDGGYSFGSFPGYVPEYVSNLKNMIRIFDKKKLNRIGDDYYALSMHWFEKEDKGIEQLQKNVSNYYNNIQRTVPADKRLWGSYKGAGLKVRGKGYTKAFLTFNAKATNAYKDKTCLVYLANLFMNVSEKVFYQSKGVEVDEDMYALSIMVQWIWRSAIREGQVVDIYIPSSRMRKLLTDWIERTSKGGLDIEKKL